MHILNNGTAGFTYVLAFATFRSTMMIGISCQRECLSFAMQSCDYWCKNHTLGNHLHSKIIHALCSKLFVLVYLKTGLVERCVVPKMNILSDQSNGEVHNSSNLTKFKSLISGCML